MLTRSDTQDKFMEVLALGQDAGVGALNQTQRVIYLVIELETIIPMESLRGFFESPLADFAEEAVEALKEIGASQSAALLHRACSLFPGGAPPRTIEERREAFWALDDKAVEAVGRLGREYLSSQDDVDGKLRALPLPPMERRKQRLRHHLGWWGCLPDGRPGTDRPAVRRPALATALRRR